MVSGHLILGVQPRIRLQVDVKSAAGPPVGAHVHVADAPYRHIAGAHHLRPAQSSAVVERDDVDRRAEHGAAQPARHEFLAQQLAGIPLMRQRGVDLGGDLVGQLAHGSLRMHRQAQRKHVHHRTGRALGRFGDPGGHREAQHDVGVAGVTVHQHGGSREQQPGGAHPVPLARQTQRTQGALGQ
ncbi:hypothetical protein GCM10010527_53030 [Streptomyces drozdowiczii]